MIEPKDGKTYWVSINGGKPFLATYKVDNKDRNGQPAGACWWGYGTSVEIIISDEHVLTVILELFEPTVADAALPVSGEIERVVRVLAGLHRSANETDEQHEAFIKHIRPVYEKHAQEILAAFPFHPQAPASGVLAKYEDLSPAVAEHLSTLEDLICDLDGKTLAMSTGEDTFSDEGTIVADDYVAAFNGIAAWCRSVSPSQPASGEPDNRALEMRNAIDMMEGALMRWPELMDLPEKWATGGGERHRRELGLRDIEGNCGQLYDVYDALAELTRIINSPEFSQEPLRSIETPARESECHAPLAEGQAGDKTS